MGWICGQEFSLANSVNPIEEALVQLLDPEGPVTNNWLENVTSLIDDMMNQVHQEIDQQEQSFTQYQDNLQLCAHKLRTLMTNHHRLAQDIKNLLKKSEENGTINSYLQKYKKFMDVILELHAEILSKDFTEKVVKETTRKIDGLLGMVNDVYNDLFAIEKDAGKCDGEADGGTKKGTFSIVIF
jgi:hypothetical protein